MSASKHTSNSNKTAHVMNLLRKNNSTSPVSHPVDAPAAVPASDQAAVPNPETAPKSPVSPAPEAKAEPVPQQAPPIIAALNADSEISLQIRDALTEELGKEENKLKKPQNPIKSEVPSPVEMEPVPALKPTRSLAEDVNSEDIPTAEQAGQTVFSEPAPAPVNIPAPERIPVSEPAPVSISSAKTSAAPMPESASTEIPDPELPEIHPAAAEKQQSPENEAAPVTELATINVMQRLVDEKADKYIKMFDVCPCSRCRMDVIALALNQLRPKYVVISPLEYMLKSDMYATRYNVEVTSQLIRACKLVKEHPNHT